VSAVDVFPIPEGINYGYAGAFNAKHRGTDIFANRGVPVVAVSNGHARRATDKLGGNVVYLRGTDGTSYYYAHLQSWAPDLEAAGDAGLDVEAGALLGFVGNTGNAANTAPHVHFQLATPDGQTVDPFPYLVEVDPLVTEPPLPVQSEIPPPPADLATIPPEPAPASPPSSASSSKPGPVPAGALLLLLLLLQQYRKGKSK
jgi:hypothetical protein